MGVAIVKMDSNSDFFQIKSTADALTQSKSRFSQSLKLSIVTVNSLSVTLSDIKVDKSSNILPLMDGRTGGGTADDSGTETASGLAVTT